MQLRGSLLQEAFSVMSFFSRVWSPPGGVEWTVLQVRPYHLSHWGSFFMSSVADLSGRSWSSSLRTVPQSCDCGVLTDPYTLPFWRTPAWPGELSALTDTGQPPPGSH